MSEKSEFSFNDLVERIKSAAPELKPTVAITQEEARLYCSHRHAVIDETKRTLNCEKCGIELNQFDFILQLAKQERHFLHKNKELQQYQRELISDIRKYERDEKNAKLRVKRAIEKLKSIDAEIAGHSSLPGTVDLEPFPVKQKSNLASANLSALKSILK